MLKFALIDFTHSGAVQILAGEEAEVVGEAAAGPPVAVVGEGELAELLLLGVALLLLGRLLRDLRLVLLSLLRLSLLLLLLQFLIHRHI